MESKELLNGINERDLHPFLVRYLSVKLNINAKTIYHEKSIKGKKGTAEWLHPDIVGFSLPVENWDEKVLDLCGRFSISGVSLYSFELKKELTAEPLRENFFQAVSNSSWANEGYLVAVGIDESNLELMQELKRLSSAFGIGVIKLNLVDCEKSEILYAAQKRVYLDGETMNKLYNLNDDFNEFVRDVLSSVKINKVVPGALDPVLSCEDLNEQLLSKKNQEKNKTRDEMAKQTLTSFQHNGHKGIALSLNNNFTNFKPQALIIGTDYFEVKNWKDLLMKYYKYLYRQDKDLFLENVNLNESKKQARLSREKPDKDENRYRYIEEIGVYAYLNLSANSIRDIMKKWANLYGLDPQACKVEVEPSTEV